MLVKWLYEFSFTQITRIDMKKFLLLTLYILSLSALIYAQAPQAAPVDSELPDATLPSPPVVYPVEVFQEEVYQAAIYDPPPKPIDYAPDVFGEMSSGLLRGSFAQDAAWNLRNNFGFSLGAQEGYYFIGNGSDNPFGSTGKQSSSATSFSASAFTNYASGKSAIHLDYGANYPFYPERRNSVDDINHSAVAAYTYRITDKARFQLRDQFSSYADDPLGDLFSINPSLGRILAGSSIYDIIFASQRYTRNSATASISADITGKGTNANVFGLYENFWYGDQYSGTGTLNDYYSAEIGVSVNQRIKNWLSLGSSYSIQLNDDLNNSQNHRVEIGRFQFALSPNVEVYASGGVEFAENRVDKGYHTRVLAHSGITWSTPINSLYADYSRTMRAVSGSRLLLPSDTVTAGLGQPIGSRTNLRLMGYYQKSSSLDAPGLLTAYQGMASMEYLIASGFFVSATYSYRYQKNSISALSGIPHAERSTISAGLQYVWPSKR